MADEHQRIDRLVERDGVEQAREWVRRTRDIYAQALADPHHFASRPGWRERFEAAIATFDRWLTDHAR